MCRLLGWAARTPRTLAEVTGANGLRAFTGLASVHGDGWGQAWAVGRGVDVRRSPDAAHTSSLYDRLAGSRRAELGIAHLRSATLGLPVSDANTHPFTDGRVAFAHNGSIAPPESLDALLDDDAAAARGGDTDSERFFLAVRRRMRDQDPADALAETVADISETSEFTSLNCVLLTPDRLFAVCRYREDAEYFGLRYRVTADSVVVSSSGWGRGWTELRDGQLLEVRRGTLQVSVSEICPSPMSLSHGSRSSSMSSRSLPGPHARRLAS